MLRISEASRPWIEPVRSPCGTDSWKPVPFSLDENDEDPLDIDTSDILLRDEMGVTPDFLDDDGSAMAFLEEYDGAELSDE